MFRAEAEKNGERALGTCSLTSGFSDDCQTKPSSNLKKKQGKIHGAQVYIKKFGSFHEN